MWNNNQLRCIIWLEIFVRNYKWWDESIRCISISIEYEQRAKRLKEYAVYFLVWLLTWWQGSVKLRERLVGMLLLYFVSYTMIRAGSHKDYALNIYDNITHLLAHKKQKIIRKQKKAYKYKNS